MINCTKRDTTFDGLKFILIIFVCWGHMMQTNHFLMSMFDNAWYRLIYSFHVSTYAFISGLFTNEKKSYSNQIITLIETIIIGNILWKVLNIPPTINCTPQVLCLTLGWGALHKCITWDIFYMPQYHLWYLSALIIWRLTSFYINRSFDKRTLLILSITLYLISTKIHLSLFTFSLVWTYFPFFVMGYIMRDKRGLLNPLWNGYKCLFYIIPFVITYFLYLLIPEIGSVTHANSGDGDMFHKIAILCADRFSFIILAPVLVLSIVHLAKIIKIPAFVGKFEIY